MTSDEAFTFFQKAHSLQRLAQGYVIVGSPQGAALDLVKKVLCLIYCEGDSAGCGQCNACLQVCGRRHFDVHWVEPEKKSRIISVEQIRNLSESVSKSAYGGGWKAGVVMFADRLGMQAANAFLKTLEEPAEKTIFFLLTANPDSLLPTILSRCQRLALHESSASLSVEICESLIEILRSGFDQNAGNGKGVVWTLGYASRLLALLGDIKETAEDSEKEAAVQSDLEIESDVIAARASAKYKEVREEILRFILDWQRDVAIIAAGGSEELVLNSDHIADIRLQAKRLGLKGSIRNTELVESINRQLDRNIPENIVFGAGISRMFDFSGAGNR